MIEPCERLARWCSGLWPPYFLTSIRCLTPPSAPGGLDYTITILRPDWFTNGNEIDYAITYQGEPESGTAISRKRIPAFVAILIEDPELQK